MSPASSLPHGGMIQLGLARTTSAFVQLCTEPQWAQVNFCFFTFAVAQSFSSIVRPVSVSLEVVGQRTSRLFSPALRFAFGRRGGSNKNRVAII
jgi:hypothetical protein